MTSVAEITDKVRERFWAKVRKTEGCWEWTAARARGKWPYGSMRVGIRSKMQQAHRISWLIHFGDIPAGMKVCHHCDNPPCVNPDHLFLGTARDNAQDSVAKGRWMSDERIKAMANPEVRAKMGARGDRNGARTHPEKVKRGEKNGRAKLTEGDVRQIRQLYRRGEYGYLRLGKRFGMSRGNIQSIVKRRSWKHVA